MKELERTKRISIAAVLSILLLTAALLNYKRPSYLYAQNTEATLTRLTETDYLISSEELEGTDARLVDVRNSYEYEKGHLPDALNIYAPELLSEEHAETLEGLKNGGKPIVLYGNNPEEVLPVFMMLCQLDIGPVKVLKANVSFEKDRLKIDRAEIEKTSPDVKAFIDSMVTNAAKKKEVVRKPVAPVKKVTPTKKKKKKMPEGGC